MEKNYKYKLATEEDRRFNSFLDRTIIGTSYNYFNKNNRIEDETVEFKEDMLGFCPVEEGVLDAVKNTQLKTALKSLTKNERSVISFVFEENLKAEEIAKVLKINKNTVYIIKKRALRKLEKLIREAK